MEQGADINGMGYGTALQVAVLMIEVRTTSTGCTADPENPGEEWEGREF
jgi:hypothetical protein